MMTLLQAQKGMPANHSQHKRLEKRLSCILRWKHRKSCSFRALERAGGHGSGYAKRWVSRYKEEKSVHNRPRAGRPSKLSSRDILFIKNLVQTDEKVGCTEIARKLATELGVRVSAETVRNNLIKSGFKYTSPRKTLQHTRIQKIRRLKWSKAYRNTHKLAFSKVMFTDSKIFTLNPSIATCSAQRWHAMGTRSSVAPARQSKGVHVYMGATSFGVTNLVFVTGGGTKVSAYSNPKTGSTHKGVCAEEYQKDVLPHLLKEGNMLFKGTRWADSWILQQDNARPHADARTMAFLRQEMGGRLLEWPPASPDLSWIENLWAWMEKELRKHCSHFKTVQELRTALTDVHKRIPRAHLTHYVSSMPGRLKRCIDREGGAI